MQHVAGQRHFDQRKQFNRDKAGCIEELGKTDQAQAGVGDVGYLLS